MPELKVCEIVEEDGYDWLAPQLLSLVEYYIGESGLPFTFDKEKADRGMRTVVLANNCHAMVLLDGDDVVGFASFTLGSFWVKEETSTLYIFYISPDYRTQGAASLLLQGCLDVASDAGAIHMYSNTVSKIDDYTTKAYEFLLESKGFERVSPLFMKEM